MKRIDAVIRKQSFDKVRDRLSAIGVEGLTVAEVIGFGRSKGIVEHYRGCEYRTEFQHNLMLTILARDEEVDTVLDAIQQGAHTGHIGDGRIFVSAVEEVVRIRTGEIGVTAS